MKSIQRGACRGSNNIIFEQHPYIFSTIQVLGRIELKHYPSPNHLNMEESMGGASLAWYVFDADASRFREVSIIFLVRIFLCM